MLCDASSFCISLWSRELFSFLKVPILCLPLRFRFPSQDALEDLFVLKVLVSSSRSHWGYVSLVKTPIVLQGFHSLLEAQAPSGSCSPPPRCLWLRISFCLKAPLRYLDFQGSNSLLKMPFVPEVLIPWWRSIWGPVFLLKTSVTLSSMSCFP